MSNGVEQIVAVASYPRGESPENPRAYPDRTQGEPKHTHRTDREGQLDVRSRRNSRKHPVLGKPQRLAGLNERWVKRGPF